MGRIGRAISHRPPNGTLTCPLIAFQSVYDNAYPAFALSLQRHHKLGMISSTWLHLCEYISYSPIELTELCKVDSPRVRHLPNSLAYWGVLNNNITIAREAYRQIKAYRKLMRDPVTGFWRHVSNNGQWEGGSMRRSA